MDTITVSAIRTGHTARQKKRQKVFIFLFSARFIQEWSRKERGSRIYIRAHFLRRCRKKPGFPLQVLGFANANPVGFPLQSLAPRSERICRMQIRGQPGRMGEQQNCVRNFATSPLARTSGSNQALTLKVTEKKIQPLSRGSQISRNEVF
jgi:hypothetical protein